MPAYKLKRCAIYTRKSSEEGLEQDFFARSLAAEFASAGVTVNVIAPGLVDTPILGNFTKQALKEFSRRVPIGRIGRPEEIAEAALYFASDESAYVTGQILNMSGGAVI